MERSLPQATPELAHAIWARQRRPSARSVARALSAAGYVAHFTTIARWRAGGWRPVATVHPVERARAALDAIAPLVTGNPTTVIDDLVARTADAEDLKARTDAELLRSAARELLIALVILTRAFGQRAVEIVNRKPGEVATGLRTIATASMAATKALAQARDLSRGS